MLKYIATLVVIVLIAACGSVPESTPTTAPTPISLPTNTPMPTLTPATLTATSVPLTQTPMPTDASGSTNTPSAAPTPIRLAGEGDSVVDVPDHNPGAIHIAGNSSNQLFTVESYDENNQQLELLVNTTEEYEGTRLFDADGRITKRMKISATGPWTVDILPPERMRQEAVPGLMTGKGDDAIRLTGGVPGTAKVMGNSEGQFFALFTYPRTRDTQLLVNTTEPYEGTVLLPTDTILIEVQAVGEWSIDVAARSAADETAVASGETPTPTLMVPTASPMPAKVAASPVKHTTADVITAFKAAGLEAEGVRPMTKKDYGVAPILAKQAVRFLMPSLGPDKWGRVFIFANADDLNKTKVYYDNLGKTSAALFSWTFARDNILVQINGDLKEPQARKYEAALSAMK